ncbi:MAG: hypothetical protein LBI43_01660 [Streptococcaceae bacterium]|jgi:hypothetical protein|nr:hypothetical protein [Streptococcaceae bacterium]
MKKLINPAIVLIGLVLYAALMWHMRYTFTFDTVTQKEWWTYLATHGFHGIATINNKVANYTTIWYFLIYSLFIKTGLYAYLGVAYCLKLIGLFFSILSAVTMYFITRRLRPKSMYLPTFCAVLTLFLPAFSMDIMKSNLSDASYLFFVLLSFLMLLKDKKGRMWFFLAFGATFKVMAIYVAPLYIYLYFRDFKKASLKERLAPLIGGAFAISLASLPNVLAGGNFFDGILGSILERTGGHVFDGGFSLWALVYGMGLGTTPLWIKIFSLTMVVLLLILTGLLIARFTRPEKEKAILYGLYPVISAGLFWWWLPAQHETYIATATLFTLIYVLLDPGFLSLLNFLFYNGTLFFAYYWISLKEVPAKVFFFQTDWLFSWHHGTYYPAFAICAVLFGLIVLFSYFTWWRSSRLVGEK